MIKREEEKSKRAETKMGQMLSAKEPEGYAECYPGMSEMNDAIDDSDDEADYSKMDLVSELIMHTRYFTILKAAVIFINLRICQSILINVIILN